MTDGGGGGGLRLAVSIAVLAFVHLVLRPIVIDWYASPNLLVCAALIGARRLRPGAAAGLGFLLGLLEDAMAVSNFGVSTLLLVVIGYLSSATRDLFVGEEALFMGTYLFIGTWTYEVAGYLLGGGGAGALEYVFLRAPLTALLTAAVGYLVLPLSESR